MPQIFYLISVVFLVYSTVQAYEKATTKEDLETAWEKYQAAFPLVIQNKNKAHSYESRKSNFFKTHYEITKHNNNNTSMYEMEHNIFSVMSDDEKKNYFGAIPPNPISNRKTIRYLRKTTDASTALSIRQLPTFIDFRNDPCMQPVKNQASCGSCWAFSATAVIEFGKCIRNGIKVTLSEQQLVDCDTVNAGCNGGWYDDAWKYLASAGGQATASSYPYRGVKGTCSLKAAIIGAILSLSSPIRPIVSKDVTTMMRLLHQKRLVSTVVAITNSFLNYRSGVYTDSNCGVSNLGYHAMTIVGYGTLNGLNYWVIRNSLGSGMGVSRLCSFPKRCQLV
uniref:Peptidase C1A papain C-terminal domain-containing protein n=1 Tax=Daphnia galeata TaxID=27404 RepID=A0A8J2W9C2_9CRUS|nr:unnamed protein product [Daphnia galeata]